MNKKIVIGLVASSILFLASGLAWAKHNSQPNNPPPPCPQSQEVDFIMGWHGPNFAAMSQFTPAQQKAVKSILENAQTKTAPQFQLLQAKTVMLNAQLYQPKVDKNAVIQLTQDINNIRAQLLQQRIDTILQIKDKTGVTLTL